MAKQLFEEKTNVKAGENEAAYMVTARKWRPKFFDDVTSQEFITKTLRNAIKNNRISHAYLFSGPRGVGKTTVARLLAKSLNCKNRTEKGEPCDVCDSCREIANDNRNHPDVFEIDGASNRNIEDIRELKEKVKYGPVRSRYKIFIIDEVHMLTGASFNALLKTLEEPPPYVIFIFATTSPEKVPLTILGRCQKFDFKRLTIEEIRSRLRHIAENENVKADEESLFFIAKKGDGSMRDAQGLFDMSAAYCDNNITFDKLKAFFNLAESDVYFHITDQIKSKDGAGLLNYFDELMSKGYDMQTFLDGLTEHYRNLMVAGSTGSVELIMEADTVKQKYKEYINKFAQIELINSLKLILQTEYTFKYSSNQRTLVEALLIELIKFTDTREISHILEELKEIKSGSGGGVKSANYTSPNNTRETASSKPAENTGVKVSYKPAEKSQITQAQNTAAAEKNNEPAEDINYVSIKNVMGDLDNHWLTIKDQIKTERKWVYSIIKDSTFGADEKENFFLRVDESTFELIDGYKDYLSGKISKYFGQSLSISLIKSTEIYSTSTEGTILEEEAPFVKQQPEQQEPIQRQEQQQGKQNVKEQDNYDKLRSILINEFKAKEVKNL
jgi:DNA polymerase-3 subunit gamma/tau